MRNIKKAFFPVFAILILFVCGCHKNGNVLSQVSTINALMAGAYGGQESLLRLLERGDTGLGTFDCLDGEMIILDGEVFKVKATGRVEKVFLTEKTPFAVITEFGPDIVFNLDKTVDYPEFKKILDRKMENRNLFYALIARGDFSTMHTRSVPAQKRPFPPLVSVVKDQSEFKKENVKGALVGFYCPGFVKGINVKGWHMHFLSEDKTSGGHVLSFEMDRALVEMDIMNKLFLMLPENQEFGNIDLEKNKENAINAVEN